MRERLDLLELAQTDISAKLQIVQSYEGVESLRNMYDGLAHRISNLEQNGDKTVHIRERSGERNSKELVNSIMKEVEKKLP